MAKELRPSPHLAEAILKLLDRCPNPVPRSFLDRQLIRSMSPAATEIMNDTILALHYQALINKMFLDPLVTQGYDTDLFRETSVYVWMPSREFEGFTDIKADPKKFYVGENLSLKEVVKAGFRLFKTASEQAKALALEKVGVSTLQVANDGSKDDPDADEGGEDEDTVDDDTVDDDQEENETEDESQSIQEIRALSKPSFKPVAKPQPSPQQETEDSKPRVAKQKEGSLDYRIVEFLKTQTAPVTKQDIEDALETGNLKVLALRLGYVVSGNVVCKAIQDDDFVYWIEGVVQTELEPIKVEPKVRKSSPEKKEKERIEQELIEAQRQTEIEERQRKSLDKPTHLVAANLELNTVAAQPSLNTRPVRVSRRFIDDNININLGDEEETEVSVTSKGAILINSGKVRIRLSGEAARVVQTFMKSMPLLEKAST